MKQNARKTTAILVMYSLLMLTMMGIAVFVLAKRTNVPPTVLPNGEETKEKYVYVYIEPEDTTPQTEEEAGWIVKEYEKRIGIFSADGELLECLEIYTKTLPKADQGLLREGITVTTRSELYALIEDYSE